MYLPGNEYDIGTATKIYTRQCSSTVRTLLEAHGGDLTEIVKTAENAKLNKKQREALRELQVQRENDEEQRLWDEAASKNSRKILEAIGGKVFEKGTVSHVERMAMLKTELWEEKAKKRKEYCDYWGIPDPEEEEMKRCAAEDLPFD